MVEFQIQCGFKIRIYAFSVWGSGTWLEALDSNLMLYGGEGINSNLTPHWILSRYGGSINSSLISHGLGGLKFGFKAPFQCKGFIRI